MGVAVKQRRISHLKHPSVGRLIPLGLCNILHPMLPLQGAILHKIITPWSKNDKGGGCGLGKLTSVIKDFEHVRMLGISQMTADD